MIIVCFRKVELRNNHQLHSAMKITSNQNKTILPLLCMLLVTELLRTTRSGFVMLEAQVLVVMVAMVATIDGFECSSLMLTKPVSLLGKNWSMEKWRRELMNKL